MNTLHAQIMDRAQEVIDRIDTTPVGAAAWIERRTIEAVNARHPDWGLRCDQTSMGEADGGYVMNVVSHLHGAERKDAIAELSRLTLPRAEFILNTIRRLDENMWHEMLSAEGEAMIQIACYELWASREGASK